MNGPTVTIYTQVYNTKPYLEQCISSVLSQSYTDFEYILVDNGCTDGSGEILDAYAESDKRIRLIRYDNNRRGFSFSLLQEAAGGRCLSFLDSDDWWEPNYLERIMDFLEQNRLDYAMTGTVQYLQQSHVSRIMRKLEEPEVLTERQFAQRYPSLWTFPSTLWGSLFTMELFRKAYVEAENIIQNQYSYGGDTLVMLQLLKHSTRIGIDNSALYHYRIHQKSISYAYHPRRFDANIACYEHIREYLELHQTFDSPKQEWLRLVHLSSMVATLKLIKDSELSGGEKIAECARIAEHPLTALALTNRCSEREQWFSLMWEILFAGVSDEKEICAEKINSVLKTLAPHCAASIQPTDLRLFIQDAVLQKLLREDNREHLARQIMDLIAQKKYIKQYDLGRMLCGLISDTSPLHGISDTRFFRKYSESCALILKKQYSDALEQMTGVLFQNDKLYAGETFLNLYLTLAALENESSAFLFGKVRLAQLYSLQKRFPECRTIVTELEEMGLTDSEELDALRLNLEAAGL